VNRGVGTLCPASKPHRAQWIVPLVASRMPHSPPSCTEYPLTHPTHFPHSFSIFSPNSSTIALASWTLVDSVLNLPSAIGYRGQNVFFLKSMSHNCFFIIFTHILGKLFISVSQFFRCSESICCSEIFLGTKKRFFRGYFFPAKSNLDNLKICPDNISCTHF